MALTKNQKKWFAEIDRINDEIKYLRQLGYEIELYDTDKPKYITQKMLSALGGVDLGVILDSYGVTENVNIIRELKSKINDLPEYKYYNGGEVMSTQKTFLMSLLDDMLAISDKHYISYLESVMPDILYYIDGIKYDSKQEEIYSHINTVYTLIVGNNKLSRTDELNELIEYYDNVFDDRYDDI